MSFLSLCALRVARFPVGVACRLSGWFGVEPSLDRSESLYSDSIWGVDTPWGRVPFAGLSFRERLWVAGEAAGYFHYQTREWDRYWVRVMLVGTYDSFRAVFFDNSVR